MAKRFVDSKIWDKRWFRTLAPEMKCAWFYLINRCDPAGVWEVDIEMMSLFIGKDISLTTLIESFDGRLEMVDNDKLWVVDFCAFQYGDLKEDYNPHKPVLKSLKKYNLFSRVNQGLTKASPSLIDKDKDKDKDKDQDQDKDQDRGKDKDKDKKSEGLKKNNDAQKFELTYNAEYQEIVETLKAYSLLTKPIERFLPTAIEQLGFDGFRDWAMGITSGEFFSNKTDYEKRNFFFNKLKKDLRELNNNAQA